MRNPEPPVLAQVPSETAKVPSEFEVPTNKRKTTEVSKLKKDKGPDINGDVLRLKTSSESSTGDGSPCSQVGIRSRIPYHSSSYLMIYF